MAVRDVQHEAMRAYRELIVVREDWGGGLVLLCGTGCVSGGAPAAVSVAGGATLAVDCDAAAMKAAMRAGHLDFVVNTLDEALRALKNEVRKQRPLGVGLIADVDETLTLMVERGVQPDLQMVNWCCVESENMQLVTLRERGMLLRRVLPTDDAGGLSAPRPGERFCDYFFAAADAGALAAVDAALLEAIGGDDVTRRRWIQRVPQYLREARSGGRWIWLSDEERGRLAANASVGEGQQARP